jgi:hypothetical protein
MKKPARFYNLLSVEGSTGGDPLILGGVGSLAQDCGDYSPRTLQVSSDSMPRSAKKSPLLYTCPYVTLRWIIHGNEVVLRC